MGVYIWTSWQLNAAYIGEWYLVPTSISLDKSTIALTTVWQTEQLAATILPVDARQTVTWTSSDTSIATVDGAWLVTCVTPWSCTITATTVNWLTATCAVGEYVITTYSIDLANSSTSTITNAWWTYYNSNMSFNDRWAYWSWRRNDVARYISNLSSYRKAVITSDIKMVAWWWYWDIYFGHFRSSSQEPNKAFMQGKVYSYNGGNWRWVLISRLDSQVALTNVATPSGYYTWVTELDLTTWKISCTISWDASWTVEYTMSSSDLSSIKSTYNYLWAWFEAASSWNWTNGHNLMTVRIDLYS